MNIDAAEPGRIKDGVGQDKAIGGNHGGVSVQGGEGGLFARALQAHRCPHIQAPRLGTRLHRRRPEPLAAPGAPGRLAIDSNDVVAGVYKGIQGRHRKVGRSHENQAQRNHLYGFFCMLGTSPLPHPATPSVQLHWVAGWGSGLVP